MEEFNYVEGFAPVKELVKSIAVALTVGQNELWEMVTPSDVTAVEDTAIISTKTNNQTFYIKIERPRDSTNHILLTMAKDKEFSGNISSAVRCAWYKSNPELYLNDWLPVKYWISFNENFANIILQGDDSVDIPPKYNNFLTSFILMGSCESYNGAVTDDVGNFFLTAGADIAPTDQTTFGLHTGNGNNDIIAVGTRTGVPYQRHESKYDAGSPFIRDHKVRESLWTQKFHASEITLTHHTDSERGKIRNLLIGSKGGLNHANELVLDKGLESEATYKFFDINAPHKFYNNGANQLYGLFLRKS